MSNIKKKPVLLFIIALIVLYVIIYVVPKVTGALVSTYTVEYGDLKTADDTDAYFVRNEKIYTAAAGGKSNRYIKEGTLIRKGVSVMAVSGSSDKEIGSDYKDILSRLSGSEITTSDFVSQNGGVVSYYADGFESKITPDNMLNGGMDYYSKLKQDDVVDLKRNNIAKGEPVFKIVDRTNWYMVCFVDEKHLDRYVVGDEIRVEFDDDYVDAEVYKVDKVDGKARIVLETDYYYAKFEKTRVAKVKLVVSDAKGLILQNTSITEKDNMKGVYIKTKTNNYVFVPIKIMDTDGEKSVVKDGFFEDEEGNMYTTIETYDEILKNPK